MRSGLSGAKISRRSGRMPPVYHHPHAWIGSLRLAELPREDIAAGQSTFMVEMAETANILNNATPRSLIILDEIGRGTSTYDGLAIARAVAEYIHSSPRLGAKTLFATHYHEMVELAGFLPRVKNFNVAVSEANAPS